MQVTRVLWKLAPAALCLEVEAWTTPAGHPGPHTGSQKNPGPVHRWEPRN